MFVCCFAACLPNYVDAACGGFGLFAVSKAIKKLKGVPVLPYVGPEEMQKEYVDFYHKLLVE